METWKNDDGVGPFDADERSDDKALQTRKHGIGQGRKGGDEEVADEVDLEEYEEEDAAGIYLMVCLLYRVRMVSMTKLE